MLPKHATQGDYVHFNVNMAVSEHACYPIGRVEAIRGTDDAMLLDVTEYVRPADVDLTALQHEADRCVVVVVAVVRAASPVTVCAAARRYVGERANAAAEAGKLELAREIFETSNTVTGLPLRPGSLIKVSQIVYHRVSLFARSNSAHSGAQVERESLRSLLTEWPDARFFCKRLQYDDGHQSARLLPLNRVVRRPTPSLVAVTSVPL